MKILNLVDESKSDIKYKINKFPDGQQNIVLEKQEYALPTQIKSRLNNWLDLELITCTVASLHELGVEEIHLYVPYIMGARSDRKFEEGSNNYLKDVICPIINSLNFKSVTCVDPHSDVLEACLNRFKKVSNEALVCAFTDSKWNQGNNIIISPDAGANKKIFKLVEELELKCDVITCSKNRDINGKLTKTVVPTKDTGPLCKKNYIIIDDICDGGATFINIAKELKKLYNCNNIYLIVTHGIFSKGYVELEEYFDGIYCTNSYKDIKDTTILCGVKSTKSVGELIKQLNVF